MEVETQEEEPSVAQRKSLVPQPQAWSCSAMLAAEKSEKPQNRDTAIILTPSMGKLRNFRITFKRG